MRVYQLEYAGAFCIFYGVVPDFPLVWFGACLNARGFKILNGVAVSFYDIYNIIQSDAYSFSVMS